MSYLVAVPRVRGFGGVGSGGHRLGADRGECGGGAVHDRGGGGGG